MYKKTVYYTVGAGFPEVQEVDFNVVIEKGSTDSSLTHAGYEFYYGKHPDSFHDSVYYYFNSEINSDSLFFCLIFHRDIPIDTLDVIWSQPDSDADNHYFQHTIIKIDWCSKVNESYIYRLLYLKLAQEYSLAKCVRFLVLFQESSL